MAIKEVEVSVPRHLSVGGLWSITSLVAIGKKYTPQVITVCIDERVNIGILRHTTTDVIVNYGVLGQAPVTWTGNDDQYNYNGVVGLVCAVLSHFGLDSVEVSVDVNFPLGIGLGGFGSLIVGLVVACMQILEYGNRKQPEYIAKLAYDILGGLKGWYAYHDQFAALSGGVRMWRCRYPVHRTRSRIVISKANFAEVESRLVLAYVGNERAINYRKYVQVFLNPTNRASMAAISQYVNQVAIALQGENWGDVIAAITSEQAILNQIDADRLLGMDDFANAITVESGAFAAAGDAHAICWFLGETPADAESVRTKWTALSGQIIPSVIATTGIQ